MTNGEDYGDDAERMGGHDLTQLGESEVGSGISLTKRASLDLLSGRDILEAVLPPWAENRALIVELFTPIFQRSNQCPGQDKPQCCHAVGDQLCCPSWVEREDPEWYALEINTYLTIVERRLADVNPTTAALAADEAFELGCLFTEALIKFRWDKNAKRGAKTIASARDGGFARRKRAMTDVIVAAVDDLLQRGKSKADAYRAIGKQQAVSAQTIAKAYRRAKKQG